MYIFAWLHKKSRASYKHWKRAAPPTRYHFFLSAGKKPPWTFRELLFFSGFEGHPIPSGDFVSNTKIYRALQRLQEGLDHSVCLSLSNFKFLPGPLYPRSLGWMRNQHLYKTPFYAWPPPSVFNPPTPITPSWPLLWSRESIGGLFKMR